MLTLLFVPGLPFGFACNTASCHIECYTQCLCKAVRDLLPLGSNIPGLAASQDRSNSVTHNGFNSHLQCAGRDCKSAGLTDVVTTAAATYIGAALHELQSPTVACLYKPYNINLSSLDVLSGKDFASSAAFSNSACRCSKQASTSDHRLSAMSSCCAVPG